MRLHKLSISIALNNSDNKNTIMGIESLQLSPYKYQDSIAQYQDSIAQHKPIFFLMLRIVRLVKFS